jgi:hypothetical protein
LGWARVGLIKAAAFKYNAYIGIDLTNCTLALWADLNRVICKGLEELKFMATVGTRILVGRHRGKCKEVRG